MTADRRPEHDSAQERRRTQGQHGGDNTALGTSRGTEPQSCVGHGAAGATSHVAGHGVAGWVLVAMIRVGTLVLCYLLVLVTAVRVIPATGVFLYENSGVDSRTPLNAQIAFWLMPLCFLVLMLLIGEVAAIRALWTLGSRWTARTRPTRPTGSPGSTRSVSHHPHEIAPRRPRNSPQRRTPRNGAQRNGAQRNSVGSGR